MKICSKCKESKFETEFYKDRSSQPSGLDYRCKICAKRKSSNSYYKVCNTASFKESRKIYRKQYYVDNKSQVLLASKLYREENKEQKAKTDKAWRQANPSKCANYTKTYRKRNKHKVRAWDAKYRADLLKRTPTYANIEKIEEFYKNCPPGMEVDHIIPLRGKNVCGFHIETNLQYLPKLENRRKSNKFGEGI